MEHLKNLGKILNQQEQKMIQGGNFTICPGYVICPPGDECIEDDDCNIEFAFEQPRCANGYCTT